MHYLVRVANHRKAADLLREGDDGAMSDDIRRSLKLWRARERSGRRALAQCGEGEEYALARSMNRAVAISAAAKVLEQRRRLEAVQFSALAFLVVVYVAVRALFDRLRALLTPSPDFDQVLLPAARDPVALSHAANAPPTLALSESAFGLS